jgi:hypothetical protein
MAFLKELTTLKDRSVLYSTILEDNTLCMIEVKHTELILKKRLIQEVLFCTNIWRRPVLLVHANLDDKNIRYISTSKSNK